MVYYLYDRNFDGVNECNVEETFLFRTCEKCHTDLAGLWEYPRCSIWCFDSLYDIRYDNFKDECMIKAYTNKSQAEDNASIIHLNEYVLGSEYKYQNIDFQDEDDIKKISTFVLLDKIKVDKNEYEEYIIKGPTINKYGYIDKYNVKQCKEYFVSDEYNALLECKKEIDEFKAMKSCPLCGGKLSKCFDKYIYISNEDKENAVNIRNERIIESTKEFKTENASAAADKFVSNLLNANNIAITENDIKDLDSFDLNKYIKNLYMVEKTILEVSERLKPLLHKYFLAEKELLSAEKTIPFNARKQYDLLEKEYNNAINKEFVPSIKIDDIPLHLPTQPVQPRVPIAPILETPGLFNKKKVLAENEILIKKHQEALESYYLANNKYNEEMALYKVKVDELINERKEKYDQAVLKEKEEYIKNIELLKIRLDDESKKLDTTTVDTSSMPESIVYNLLKPEVDEAVEILKKAVDLRASLYSYDIVFAKYRDIVSIATFYEYLSAGRCQELQGTNGAYNLYENEIRMNMIVSNLEQVVKSLEDIKQNQYVIYSAIQEMNSQLSAINKSMDAALVFIANMNDTLSNIDKNTEVIAYNTERTAFYAKKNAELTNALGYLVALK